MAWDDVLQSFVQTAGSAFKTYEQAQTPPITVPPGSSVVTSGGQTYIQPQNTMLMWFIIIAAALVIGFLVFRRA